MFVGRIFAPNCRAYGRRSTDKAWPWPTLKTVGRAEGVGDPREVVDVADALLRLLDELLGPGTTLSSRVIVAPLLKVTDTAIGPSAWPDGTVACNRLPLSPIQSWLGNDWTAVGTTLAPNSCRAYGRRSSERAWPCPTFNTVGRGEAVAVEDPEEVAEDRETLARLLDELVGPGMILNCKVTLWPLLKVTDTATFPSGWSDGTATCSKLPLRVIQSTLGEESIFVGTMLPPPSWAAYGRRSNDRVWPCPMLRTVGRAVAVEVEVDRAVEKGLVAVDVGGALAKLLDELLEP